MADQKESSVLFSLKELMNLEEDRIREEEAEKARRARAELDAREAKDRAARDAEERRLREEEERRRGEDLRKREEQTRLEAIRQGEVEKARAEAEHRARMDAMAAQQAHEAKLATINQDEHKKRLQMTVGVIAFVFVAALIGGGVYFKKHNDQVNRERAENERARAELEARATAAENQVKQSQEKESELKSALNNAKDEADRARIQQELTKAQEQTAVARRSLHAVGGGSTSSGSSGASKPASKPACNCTPGDPLCSCL
jgi:colicin import membrane protein